MSATYVGALPAEVARKGIWEVQCARCGSTLVRESCENCGGEGVSGHDCGEDTCCCPDPYDNVRCGMCRGTGGFWACLSGTRWCMEHPRDGRIIVPPHTPEWYRA